MPVYHLLIAAKYNAKQENPMAETVLLRQRHVCYLTRQICRVGQNRIFTLCMTICMVISLPKFLYIHRIYL